MSDKAKPTDKISNDYGTTIIVKPTSEGVKRVTMVASGPNGELNYSGTIPAEQTWQPLEYMTGQINGGTPNAAQGGIGSDEHNWCSIPMSKKEIGIAFGLPDNDPKIAESVNALCRTIGVVLKPDTRKKCFVAVDTLTGRYLERFRQYMQDLYHYTI